MRFDQFIKERLYLHNVSPRTIEWYEQSSYHRSCQTLVPACIDSSYVSWRNGLENHPGVSAPWWCWSGRNRCLVEEEAKEFAAQACPLEYMQSLLLSRVRIGSGLMPR